MPIGEFVGEVLLRVVLEFIFYTVFYFTGYPVVWILTLGQINMAPFSTIDETNRGKNRWTDWSMWLNRGGKKMLKAEYVCLVGMISWILIGVAIYFSLKESEPAIAANSLPAVVLG